MHLFRSLDRLVTMFFLILLCVQCSSKHDKASVEAAMQHYNNLILSMNADSISLFYSPDGNLGEIALGRDSIRAFLFSFKGFKVLSQASSTKRIEISGDSAWQQGNYFQTAITPNRDTLRVKGEFTAHWIWIPHQEWRIKKMVTRSMH